MSDTISKPHRLPESRVSLWQHTIGGHGSIVGVDGAEPGLAADVPLEPPPQGASRLTWRPLVVGHVPGMASPSVARLMRPVVPMRDSEACLAALARFHDESALMSIPVLDAHQIPVALIDRHTYVEFLSRLYSRELFGGRPLRDLLHGDDWSIPVRKPLLVDADTSIDDVAQIVIGAGMRHMVSGVVVTRDGMYAGVANGNDLLDELTRRKQEDLFFLAHYDSLTQIPNRMLFTDRLSQACRDARRKDGRLAIMFIDVDRFKQVNDSLGHRFGDLLLQGVARRLRACVRDCDTVARLGGDEFAILIEDGESTDHVAILAERLLESVNAPFTILDRTIQVSLSIGIAHCPDDDDDVGGLLSKADAAMYEAKTHGRNGFRQYQPGMFTSSAEKLGLEAELKRALANQEFFLCYQPQLSLASGEVSGVEALIRWRHPERGMLTPGSFIGLAEECGLIVPIGDWVLSTACEQVNAWRRQGLPPLRISVNISAPHFGRADFARRVESLLRASGMEPHMLELELTESMVMSRSRQVLETLEALRDIGVRLSLDDFGTGFSSLGYLRSFPIHRLKIDQSFVREAHLNPVNASIIRAIVALARSLSIEVVAEGVEMEAELALVRDSGCDESQGYLHAKPMSSDAFVAWMGAKSARH